MYTASFRTLGNREYHDHDRGAHRNYQDSEGDKIRVVILMVRTDNSVEFVEEECGCSDSNHDVEDLS